jgi:ABC-type multidrug transport system ATPase subunit
MIDLKAQDISVKRGDFELPPLSFSLKSGELIALKGPNGSGKTSVLKMLQRRLRPDRGEISGLPDIIGCVGIEPTLMGSWKVSENIQWIESLSRKTCDAKILSGIEHLRHKRFDHLSLGWQRRVELALFLSLNLPLYLLDEALSPLDTEARLSARTEIERMKFSGTAFLVTSHREGDFDSLATRVVTLS